MQIVTMLGKGHTTIVRGPNLNVAFPTSNLHFNHWFGETIFVCASAESWVDRQTKLWEVINSSEALHNCVLNIWSCSVSKLYRSTFWPNVTICGRLSTISYFKVDWGSKIEVEMSHFLTHVKLGKCGQNVWVSCFRARCKTQLLIYCTLTGRGWTVWERWVWLARRKDNR